MTYAQTYQIGKIALVMGVIGMKRISNIVSYTATHFQVVVILQVQRAAFAVEDRTLIYCVTM